MDDRNNSIELTNQATKKINTNEIDTAVVLLTNVLLKDSTYHPTYIQLYTACLSKKEYADTTIYFLKKAIKIFEEDDEICFYIGELYRYKTDYKNSIKWYSDAIKYSIINGEDFSLVPSYYFNRANSYMKLDSLDVALLDFNYALKLKPNYSFALANRGTCFFMKGNKDDACNDWTKAKELGNGSANEYVKKHCSGTKSINKPKKQVVKPAKSSSK